MSHGYLTGSLLGEILDEKISSEALREEGWHRPSLRERGSEGVREAERILNKTHLPNYFPDLPAVTPTFKC